MVILGTSSKVKGIKEMAFVTMSKVILGAMCIGDLNLETTINEAKGKYMILG